MKSEDDESPLSGSPLPGSHVPSGPPPCGSRTRGDQDEISPYTSHFLDRTLEDRYREERRRMPVTFSVVSAISIIPPFGSFFVNEDRLRTKLAAFGVLLAHSFLGVICSLYYFMIKCAPEHQRLLVDAIIVGVSIARLALSVVTILLIAGFAQPDVNAFLLTITSAFIIFLIHPFNAIELALFMICPGVVAVVQEFSEGRCESDFFHVNSSVMFGLVTGCFVYFARRYAVRERKDWCTKVKQKAEIRKLSILLFDINHDAQTKARESGDSDMAEVCALLESSYERCQGLADLLEKQKRSDLSSNAELSASEVLRAWQMVTKSDNLFTAKLGDLREEMIQKGIVRRGESDGQVVQAISGFLKAEFTQDNMRRLSSGGCGSAEQEFMSVVAPMNSSGGLGLSPCDCKNESCTLNRFWRRIPPLPLDINSWKTDLYSLAWQAVKEHDEQTPPTDAEQKYQQQQEQQQADGTAAAATRILDAKTGPSTSDWCRPHMPYFLLPAVCVRYLSPFLHTLRLERQRGISILESLGKELERRYPTSPYHNSVHAAEVTLSTIWLTEHCGVRTALPRLKTMAMTIAALCHDVGHPGVNNQFLKSIMHPLAVTYNDMSVLENFHAAETFRVLASLKDPAGAATGSSIIKFAEKEKRSGDGAAEKKEDKKHSPSMASESSRRRRRSSAEINLEEMEKMATAKKAPPLGAQSTDVQTSWQGPLLCNLSPANARALRQMIVELILSTDMSHHFDFVSKLKVRRQSPDFLQQMEGGEEGQQGGWDSDVWMTTMACLKMADLGHSAKPWEIHERYSLAVAEEFFQQGGSEKDLKLPVSSLCDRQVLSSRAALAKSQTGFISFVCVPLMSEIVEVELSFRHGTAPNVRRPSDPASEAAVSFGFGKVPGDVESNMSPGGLNNSSAHGSPRQRGRRRHRGNSAAFGSIQSRSPGGAHSSAVTPLCHTENVLQEMEHNITRWKQVAAEAEKEERVLERGESRKSSSSMGDVN
uniref:Phosphodiesterase n=1 Tax=Chromera velia CCMP2878 TaxID=1169474 RepID=A0A0G4F0I5_9ALVE|eukprot:Cvel_14577.t1-p1 / transcript=Cvel_14577.t1 / gene=Cvel_14577 / organism=Chromera_velia_CCMP2878 / gene_product=Calcium/calmodulin-dependent 3',5'-cyclic, putative / transcript_product=Calcium/calmodulin-dependent 3',5'-cyclic, putative / location=Cvel_scaffold1042:18198-23289(-) / protein_length=991 / sequence_SO=supercontig / SO=protein_coding / is_pseudo=false